MTLSQVMVTWSHVTKNIIKDLKTDNIIQHILYMLILKKCIVFRIGWFSVAQTNSLAYIR